MGFELNIIDQLIDLLNINCRYITCNYPNPLEGLFYLIFFPTVFIVLFIYILSGRVLSAVGSDHQGLRLLVAVSVYIFIIMQGWYTLFISLSKMWYILIILLFGFWWFFRGHKGGGGGKGGALSGITGKGTGLLEAVKDVKTLGGLEKAAAELESLLVGIKDDIIEQSAHGLETGELQREFNHIVDKHKGICDEIEKIPKKWAKGFDPTNIADRHHRIRNEIVHMKNKKERGPPRL
jgi:hypothetical protein